MSDRNPFSRQPHPDDPATGWNTLTDLIAGLVIVAAIVVAAAWIPEMVR